MFSRKTDRSARSNPAPSSSRSNTNAQDELIAVEQAIIREREEKAELKKSQAALEEEVNKLEWRLDWAMNELSRLQVCMIVAGVCCVADVV